MYSRISSGDIPGDEQNTDSWYMDYPDGLPLSFLFLLVTANTSKFSLIGEEPRVLWTGHVQIKDSEIYL